MFNPMFTATVFTIARIWKQLKYLSADDWVHTHTHTHTHTQMDYYSTIKNEILSFTTA